MKTSGYAELLAGIRARVRWTRQRAAVTPEYAPALARPWPDEAIMQQAVALLPWGQRGRGLDQL